MIWTVHLFGIQSVEPCKGFLATMFHIWILNSWNLCRKTPKTDNQPSKTFYVLINKLKGETIQSLTSVEEISELLSFRVWEMDTHLSNRNQKASRIEKKTFILWNCCHSKSEFKNLTIPDAICGIKPGQGSNYNYSMAMFLWQPGFSIRTQISYWSLSSKSEKA